MITKTTLTAIAFATAIAAQPATMANAGSVSFGFGIQTNDGFISFGTGNHNPGYGDGGGYDQYSCSQARQELKWEYKRVKKIECNGKIFTFKVRKQKHIGKWKVVKFNRDTGNYWIA